MQGADIAPDVEHAMPVLRGCVTRADPVGEEVHEDNPARLVSSKASTSVRGVAQALPTKTLSPGRTTETASAAEAWRSRQSAAAWTPHAAVQGYLAAPRR